MSKKSCAILCKKSWDKMLPLSTHAQEIDKEYREAHDAVEDIEKKIFEAAGSLSKAEYENLERRLSEAKNDKIRLKTEIDRMIQIYKQEPLEWKATQLAA